MVSHIIFINIFSDIKRIHAVLSTVAVSGDQEWICAACPSN